MKNICFFYLVVTMLVFSTGPVLHAEPGPAEVKEELAKIRKELDKGKTLEKKQPPDRVIKDRSENTFFGSVAKGIGKIIGGITKFFLKIINWIVTFLINLISPIVMFLLQLGSVGGVAMVLVLLLIVVFTGYRAAMLLGISKNRSKAGEVEESSPLQDLPEYSRTTNQLYNQALARAGEGDYSRALVLLHKATVRYLFDQGIISNTREYTNGELRRIIKGRDYEKTFSSLALQSEFIKFKHLVTGQEVYDKLHLQYQRDFRGGR